MNVDVENVSSNLNLNKSLRIYVVRKWRSLPRVIKLYSILVLFCFLTFFGFLMSYISISSSSSLIANGNANLNEKQLVTSVNNVNLDSIQLNKKLDVNDNYYITELDLQEQIVNEKQKEIIEAARHTWYGYKQYAWGSDHLKPITRSSHNWFGVGLTIIDSLDTLLLLNMNDEFEDALEWTKNELNFNRNRDVNCFEMTIRILGGLLSAYHLTSNELFKTKAIDIGDRLIHCFDSPSKLVPYSDVNLATKHSHSPLWSPDSSLSEISSVQLEFRYLSQLTLKPLYEQRSFRTSIYLHNLTKITGNSLLPMFVNPINGKLSPSTVTLGARGDSYYEYLLKQYLQTNITWLLDDYLKAINAVDRNLIQTTTGPLHLTFIGEQLRQHSNISPKMDHLVCFLPGTLALGYLHSKNKPQTMNSANKNLFEHHLNLAEKLARTCYHMYNLTETGLSPEIAYFSLNSNDKELQIRPADTHNLLRPEYVESLFYLYHITGNEMYREQGWKIFTAFNRYCRVKSGGYTSIGDVRNPASLRPRDMQESFWLAETLKYLYLLFSDDKNLIHKLLNNYIINTEAHLIPIIL